MTYMFEYPQFVVRISVCTGQKPCNFQNFQRISTKADKRFYKYGLYAYSEGRSTERARNMQFNGIPVLFIPGNAGSFKQGRDLDFSIVQILIKPLFAVRSLASVALRKSLSSRPGFHFDYFTVDLNEELSALNGGVVFEQQLYVNNSIYHILELYKNVENSPKSVVLIAHSMVSKVVKSLRTITFIYCAFVFRAG